MRIVAVDFGKKRCGIAATDPSKIIASPLTSVDTKELQKWLTDYCTKEEVETIVFGYPKTVNNEDSETVKYLKPFVGTLKKAFAANDRLKNIRIDFYDERFTTKIAFSAMLAGGVKKQDRNNKNGLVDKVSASIILQDYMTAIM